eukprot:7154-Heterococcus_DN1.PRE.4
MELRMFSTSRSSSGSCMLKVLAPREDLGESFHLRRRATLESSYHRLSYIVQSRQPATAFGPKSSRLSD